MDEAELVPVTLTVLRPDAEPEELRLDLARHPGLKKLREVLAPYLDGGELEHVSVLHQGRRSDMFVDDIGVLKELPRNEAATAIYRSYWLESHPGTDPETLPPICGPAILFSRQVWF